MTPTPPQSETTTITLERTSDYREGYANSVQIRLSIWDFLLVFGTLEHRSPEEVKVANFQGVYLSPQQAKALLNLLSHNVAQYEQTFGKIHLDSQEPGSAPYPVVPRGPVH